MCLDASADSSCMVATTKMKCMSSYSNMISFRCVIATVFIDAIATGIGHQIKEGVIGIFVGRFYQLIVDCSWVVLYWM